MEDFQDNGLRASDEDREKVAETLRENYAQGRLTLEEFDERSTSAYAAKTLGDLRALTNDLPVPAVRPQPVPEAPPPPPRNPHQQMWWVPLVALAVVGVAVVSLTSGHVHIWPLWIFVFLIFRGFGRGRHNRP